MAPRVTVLMPVFNGERFVDEAIESVLRQDFRDFELLVIDDASSDGTAERLDAWVRRDDRVVVHRNPVNRGAAGSANVGMRLARGQYLARQDADDLSLAGRLRREVATLDDDPSTVLVATDFLIIDEAGRVIRTERRAQPPEVIEYLLHFTNALGGHSQVMMRTQALRDAGGYDETRRTGEDYELWTRLIRAGRIRILPFAGMAYRVHGAQATAQTRDDASRARAIEFSRTLLSGLLGREVTREETEAATTAGGRERRANARLADRVHREAFGSFTSRVSDPELRVALRRAIAERFGTTAALLLRHGRSGEALRHLLTGCRWHVAGAPAGLLRLGIQSLASRFRRIVPRVA
jgi:glycosyltransferase involved in cell wall biosynthesis